jgi:tRNA-dihydrouridine synthase B
MHIGNVVLKNQVVLAPMAGVTDSSFRLLAVEMGAALVFSEMVSAKGAACSPAQTLRIAQFTEDERPLGIQLFGSDPETMARGAELTAGLKPDLIDLNMGCPVRKVISKGEGCALMRDPEKAYSITRAVCCAVNIPVTVKMRKGWNDTEVNALEVALAVQEAGAAAVTVHGRTREQGYSGSADWTIIKQVKDRLTIPVIGNGDVRLPGDAARMIAETGCDAVMIGRGILGNLWLIRRTVHFLKTGELLPEPDITQRVALALKHLDMTVADKGEHIGVREMRKHVAWYLKGLRGAAQTRNRVMRADNVAGMKEILQSLIV